MFDRRGNLDLVHRVPVQKVVSLTHHRGEGRGPGVIQKRAFALGAAAQTNRGAVLLFAFGHAGVVPAKLLSGFDAARGVLRDR